MSTTSEIWNEFSAPLREFIRRRVRDDHVAEDLLQDVFVRVHDKLGSLSDDDRLTAWLFRIARNAIIDHHRRRSPGELDGTEFLEDQHADEGHVNQQMGECVSRLAKRLPSDYREAVEMAELNDVPQKAIAQRIGLSLSGTKSRIQRGRKMLKAMLLDCCQFEFDRSGNVIDYRANSSDQSCCSEEKMTSACSKCDE